MPRSSARSGKLANQGFVDKAPEDVVQQERDKLERFERELAELEALSEHSAKRAWTFEEAERYLLRSSCSACGSGSSACAG